MVVLDLINQGKGDYCVVCNGEYWLAKKGDEGENHHHWTPLKAEAKKYGLEL